jgi:very-short-patch-repair endonuclease
MAAPQIPVPAQQQAGVFTRTQAYDAGWTRRQVRRRLEVGHWQVVAGAAIAVGGLEIGAWQLAQAVLLSWPGAVVSHDVAGRLWGFPIRVGETATATSPAGRKLVGQRATVRRLSLGPEEVVRMGRVPVTAQRRTAVDLLASLAWGDARNLWAWLSTRERLTLDDVRGAALARRTWLGTGQLHRLVAVSTGGSLSAAEDRLHALLRAAGLGGWAPNARVVLGSRTVVVDVLFASRRLVIEVDGWSTHGGREAFQRDRSNGNALTAAGYVVLRFTWDDLTRRPEAVLATIQAALG